MIIIKIDAEDTEGTVKQIRDKIGGQIVERWGEYTLNIENENASGNIRFITFDWGVSLLEYDITFYKEVTLIMNTSKFNPIHFSYCLEGYCAHKFGFQRDEEIKILEQYQSVIITSRDGDYNYGYFPKDLKLAINVIQIARKPFLRKRLNQGEELNQKLYSVFLDTDHEKVFSYFGTYNLKLADKISALRTVKGKGMIRIMQIQGLVYQILSMHMLQHNREVNNKPLPTTLLKRELAIIRNCAKNIEKNISKPYTLETISMDTGLTQAKLQEGFKLLYSQTVTEFIRNARLEVSRDLINNTDLSISEIVYTIGFTSRSYFSKIFKEKYALSPSEVKNNKKQMSAVA